jgi:hypothetical protein
MLTYYYFLKKKHKIRKSNLLKYILPTISGADFRKITFCAKNIRKIVPCFVLYNLHQFNDSIKQSHQSPDHGHNANSLWLVDLIFRNQTLVGFVPVV